MNETMIEIQSDCPYCLTCETFIYALLKQNENHHYKTETSIFMIVKRKNRMIITRMAHN